jgi:hypothetical protein
MNSKHFSILFSIGAVLGSLIACSPTKFSQQAANTLCAGVSKCVAQNGSVDIAQSYKVGSGKVDILFVNDNSASMSKVQVQLAAKFSGFIQSLDSKSTDYRIAITTTDVKSVSLNKLITLSNGNKYLTNADSNRVSLFNNSIIRSETLACEDLITSMFNTYGTSFQSNSYYAAQYPIKCPSSDTRGIYTANMVVSENSSSFMRSDANLNVILISNDNVRQGASMESMDQASTFTALMQQKYPNKYWDFNSIIVKDSTCKQSQTLYNAANQVVMNQYGPAISGGIGTEYANLSNSAARDIDNNPRPRGQVLDICQSDYAHNFNSMATQISESARMFTMRCTPTSEPIVVSDSNSAVSHTWSGDKIVFPKGTEGTSVSISYNCYTGPT